MKLTATLLIAGSLLASGCSSSLEATYDYDPGVNFAALQTYTWETGEIAGDVGQFTVDRVRTITDQVMAEKGYREGPNPDFVIEMHGGRAEMHEAGWGWSGMQMETINRGALVLHVKDASSRRTIWSGSVVGEALENPTPDQQTQRLTEAINALLASFPPN